MNLRRAALRAGVALAAATAVVNSAPAGAATISHMVDGAWIVSSATTRPSATADQGSATVIRSGRPRLITRGSGSIPPQLAAAGWRHIGDPGAVGGTVVDAYQSGGSAKSILFTLTTADGSVYRYLHRLDAGDTFHNSFAAVSPDGNWLVSGGWHTERSLRVFAMPHPTGSSRTTRALSTAATITLTRPVRNVQGCAFAGTTTLFCATNDPSTDLFPVPRQLLAIHLDTALHDGTVRGRPALVGSAPTGTHCTSGVGEVEGVDVHHGRLVVSVNSPCSAQTQLFTLSAAPRDGPALDIDTHLQWTRSVGAVAVAPTASGRQPGTRRTS